MKIEQVKVGRISISAMVAIFLLLSLFLIVIGHWYYEQTTQAIQSQKTDELRAIAALKIQQIVKWRLDSLTDSQLNSSGIIGSEIIRWLANPADLELQNLLLSHWRFMMAAGGYRNILLTSPKGDILLSAENKPGTVTLGKKAVELIQQAVVSRTAILGDFAYSDTHGHINLDLASPIIDKSGQVISVVFLRIDPEAFLFPLIQSWPTPSSSAETLLVRRDGDDALFLNELRHQPSPPLAIRIPMTRTDVPAIAALKGKAGVFVGNDYRGVPVVSVIDQVPGSPWFMVAKIDFDEIFAAARSRGKLILLLIFMSIIVSGSAVASLFNRQQRDLYENNKHQLEELVVARTKELETVNKELEAFSYSVSHDLKAPLRSIDGFARYLEEDYAGILDTEGRRLLKVIRGSAKEMGQLITDLLDFSRMSRKDLEMSRLNMEELVTEVWSQTGALREGREIRLSVGTLPAARGDKVTIREVLLNFLTNSIKFTRLCDKPVIEVTGYEENGESVFVIKDNGVGFDMTYREKMFCVFQRLHSSEQFEGTGVGLAIVHRVIQRHGGRVWAEGKENEGATFYFTLPTEIIKEKKA